MADEPFEQQMRRGGAVALKEASRFFMRQDKVHETLRRITQRLSELGIPYAVAGGMALVAHGYDRTTDDVDIIVDADGLKRVHKELDGLGYVPPFPGSKHLRDTTSAVRIEFLVAGQFPGDGKPKPVAFPSPGSVSVEIDGIRFVRLVALVELKLASGMTNPGRIKDLGDVQELIKVLQLPESFVAQLNPYVRDEFLRLWRGAAADHSPE